MTRHAHDYGESARTNQRRPEPMTDATEKIKPQRRGDAKRKLLIDIGTAIFTQKGFSSTGLGEIVQAAEVPKGSFYYYFESKEHFGLAVIDDCAKHYVEEVERHLGDTSLGPLERLRSYFEASRRRLESRQCRSGCIFGNLGQEMADQSEQIRGRLAEVFGGLIDRYAGCLREAQAAGEIRVDLDVHAVAEFCLGAWQGAILRAKMTRSTAPLQTFLDVLFGNVLRPC